MDRSLYTHDFLKKIEDYEKASDLVDSMWIRIQEGAQQYDSDGTYIVHAIKGDSWAGIPKPSFKMFKSRKHDSLFDAIPRTADIPKKNDEEQDPKQKVPNDEDGPPDLEPMEQDEQSKASLEIDLTESEKPHTSSNTKSKIKSTSSENIEEDADKSPSNDDKDDDNIDHTEEETTDDCSEDSYEEPIEKKTSSEQATRTRGRPRGSGRGRARGSRRGRGRGAGRINNASSTSKSPDSIHEKTPRHRDKRSDSIDKKQQSKSRVTVELPKSVEVKLTRIEELAKQAAELAGGQPTTSELAKYIAETRDIPLNETEVSAKLLDANVRPRNTKNIKNCDDRDLREEEEKKKKLKVIVPEKIVKLKEKIDSEANEILKSIPMESLHNIKKNDVPMNKRNVELMKEYIQENSRSIILMADTRKTLMDKIRHLIENITDYIDEIRYIQIMYDQDIERMLEYADCE